MARKKGSKNGKRQAMLPSVVTGSLTEMEKFMAEDIVYQCFTGMTIDEIAAKYGMTVGALHRHRVKKAFVDEINKLSEQLHKSYRADVDNAVREIIATGDHRTKLKAAELFYRQTGCFNTKAEEDSMDTDSLDIEDILLELQRSLPVQQEKIVREEIEAEEVEYEDCSAEDILDELIEDSVDIEDLD
jgi:AcrR family transcriptional regulator